eukprot:TRINITY_DN68364_c0_g1_i1.p1 TRINITY_DN68364_c0_g1~~TRINITY_DN68364_c0_g1_i1.p1  ORF type:complete len:224 (+),score=58.77 TRINITY_DN68364_c0_g1_i1:100-771(+)
MGGAGKVPVPGATPATAVPAMAVAAPAMPAAAVAAPAVQMATAPPLEPAAATQAMMATPLQPAGYAVQAQPTAPAYAWQATAPMMQNMSTAPGVVQPMQMQMPPQVVMRQPFGVHPPDDVTALQVGTVCAGVNCCICGCGPCLGAALYFMNEGAPHGSERKQWAQYAGMAGLFACAMNCCSCACGVPHALAVGAASGVPPGMMQIMAVPGYLSKASAAASSLL